MTSATRAHLASQARLVGREPAAIILAGVLPLAAVIVMSSLPAARQPLPQFGGFSVVASYVPTLLLFGTSMLAMVFLPQWLGSYRELGYLRRLRTTPASPSTLLTAMFILVTGASLVLAGLIVTIPAVFGAGLPRHFGTFALLACLTVVCFVATGTALCAVIPNPRIATGIGNVVAAVMWFFAGLWFPRAQFPDWLRVAADLTPGGAAAEGMLRATQSAGSVGQPVLVLVVWTLLAAFIAARTFRWE